MKIILLADIRGTGKKNEIKNVSDGYALNFLIPKGLAQIATDKKIDVLKKVTQIKKDETELKKSLIEKKFIDIANKEIHFYQKTNEKGILFAKIHKGDITKKLKEEFSFELDEDDVLLDKPISETGTYNIEIKLLGKKRNLEIKIFSN